MAIRLLFAAVVVVLLTPFVAVVVLVTPAYGSSSAPDATGLLSIEYPEDGNAGDDEGEDRPDRTRYVYRHDLGITVMTLASVRNDGPVPLTVVGVGDPPPDAERTSLVWAERLVDSAWPEVVPPDPSLPFSPTVLEAGGQDAFWVVWRTGSACRDGQAPVGPGSGIVVNDLPLRWTILGIPRGGVLALEYDLELLRPEDEPPLSC